MFPIHWSDEYQNKDNNIDLSLVSFQIHSLICIMYTILKIIYLDITHVSNYIDHMYNIMYYIQIVYDIL